MPASDDDPLEPDGRRLAFTRTELLRARGYPDEIVNGHATPDAVEPAPPSSPDISTCRQCGAELAGPASRVWCSDKCRRRYRTLHQAPPSGSAPTKPTAGHDGLSGPTISTEPPTGHLLPTGPAGVRRTGRHAGGTDIAGLVAAVLAQPWREITVALDGMTITLATHPEP
jgi:hypothetical protein